MSRVGASLLCALALCAPRVASAFESECTRDDGTSRSPLAIEAAICRTQFSGLDDKSCGDGVQFARGAQLGEHTFITYQGMLWAGIPDALMTDQDVLRYYGSGETITGSGGVTSIAPAAPTRMRARVTRPISIAEFSQALDGSYSLADFLNGNEHCPISSQTTGSFAELEACHQFASHLQVTNSTHFSPQNREMARRYHGMALQTADRCLAMHEAFMQQSAGVAEHPLAARTDQVVRQCIKEALAIEAIASHFLEDAWSTGHMWQRWGSPLFPDDSRYVANHLAGIVSGIIHGWRSVTRDVFGVRQFQHDQMCMPGPFTPNQVVGGWQSTEEGADWTVTYAYPGPVAGATARPTPGGGDCYLLPCSAREYDAQTNPNPRWALWYDKNSNQTTPLFAQRMRMMTCVRRGFEEVYERLPPTFGALTPQVDEQYLDKAIPKAAKDQQNKSAGMQSDACWNQRVTNESMLLAGSFGPMPLNLWNPLSAARFGVDFAEWRAGTLSPDDEARQAAIVDQRDAAEVEVRRQLVIMGAYVALRADEAPHDTDLAELSAKEMATLHGVARNSEGVTLIKEDAVPYLEHADRFYWFNDRFGPCNKDEDCRAISPRSYCDPGALVTDNASAPGCVLYDTAVARAFREAETIYWCSLQDLGDVRAARAACKTAGPTSAECAACVELVLPRLRNGCEPSLDGFTPKPASGGDNRAMCDLLVDAELAPGVPRIPGLFKSPRVYWPYEQHDGETPAVARERAAREACLNGDDGSDGKTAIASYGYVPTPPATGDAFPVISRSTFAGTCGLSSTPTHWYRLTASDVSTYRVRLQPTTSNTLGTQPPEKLKLDVFGGPACDPTAAPLATGVPVDDNLDGATDWLELAITVPALPYEVCVRVTAVDKTTRTTWGLYIDRQF